MPVIPERVQELMQAKSRVERYGVIEKIAKEGEKMGYSRLRRNKPHMVIAVVNSGVICYYLGLEITPDVMHFNKVLVVDPFYASCRCRMILRAASGIEMITLKLGSISAVQFMVENLLQVGKGSKKTSMKEDDSPVYENPIEVLLKTPRNVTEAQKKFEELFFRSPGIGTEAQKGSSSDVYSFAESMMDTEQEGSYDFPRRRIYAEIGQLNATVADAAN